MDLNGIASLFLWASAFCCGWKDTHGGFNKQEVLHFRRLHRAHRVLFKTMLRFFFLFYETLLAGLQKHHHK